MKTQNAPVVATVIGSLFMLALTDVSAAQDRLVVPLPDVSGLSAEEARDLGAQIAQADVISSNCPGHAVSDGEWTLLAGTGKKLAARLDLDPTAYEREFLAPAYQLLDQAGSCERVGSEITPLIERLVQMGGGTAPVPSQPE